MTYSDYREGVKTDLIKNSKEALTLPKSDVLSFEYENGLKFIVRPSGTEPKIKFYLFVNDKDNESAELKLKKLTDEVLDIVNKQL